MKTKIPIEVWQVYYFKCHCTLPEPKEKYVVIVYVEPPQFFGFLINSKINDYLIQQKLQICEALIKNDQHSFKKPLKRDSYVDCREICPVSENELFDLPGVLSRDAKNAVIEAVNACRVLQRRYKKRILSQLTPA
ncbi:MAG: hypothetical protein VSS75_023485 [Candidatus Parabeggiatoa sp.]|nr:hypothetical protein [Candidatus Parabeggiatoa sp.]